MPSSLLTPQLSQQLAKLSTRTSLWLAIASVGWFAELFFPRLNASFVQTKLSRVGGVGGWGGGGVVGLYENKANLAPARLGLG